METSGLGGSNPPQRLVTKIWNQYIKKMFRTLTTFIGTIGNQIAEMEVGLIQVSLEIQRTC